MIMDDEEDYKGEPVMYNRTVFREDARPRQEGEEGTHDSSIDVYPPGDTGAKPVRLYFMPDGGFEVHREGKRLRCTEFERDEDGQLVFLFEEIPE